MTKSYAAYTHASDSVIAGQELGQQIHKAFAGVRPDAVIVFASSVFDHEALLRTLTETCQPRVLVGSSSAGEFTGNTSGEGSACALAISSETMRFAAGVSSGVSHDRAAAAQTVVSGFHGVNRSEFPYRAALVMTDALAGHADDLIEQMTVATSGTYEFAGGGAGDDAKFAKTHVFCGTRALTDSVVALEMLSHKPIGIGVQHGWSPASDSYRVTSVEGARILTLDGFPAADVFEHHAEATKQRLDRADPLPFFLHNIIGIVTSAGHRLRVPLSIGADGSVTCAAEISAGAKVQIMKTSAISASDAAAAAARSALRALGGEPASAALFFDCVATRLRLGDAFGYELQAVNATLGGTNLVGCNTYGQIARANGQFGGFHNCTAVVLALPQ